LTSKSGHVAGILLAAGDGSRIGQPKALVVIGGQSLARRGIGLLEAGGARPVIVVSGAASLDAELRELVWPAADHGTGASDRERSAVISVHNPRWQAGMGSSLAAGLAAVPGECTSWAQRRCAG
jgi:CTP:molybdopterin cytidylyltransferase MocA